MEYVRKEIPLWSITIWDKKFNNVEKEWQPKVRKYKYLLADELDSIKNDNGDIRILYTGKDVGFTTEELAGDAISDGEVVTIPWGGIPTVKYHKGKFVTGDNRIATSSDTSLLTNKYLYYYMKGNINTIASFYRGASLKHPSMRDVLKMNISFPSVEEQNSIVKQFDSLERLITLRQQELQKLDELIKARFVEMFESIDKKVAVGSLCDVSGGYSFKSGDISADGDVRILQIGNVYLDDVNWETTNYLPEGFDDTYSRFLLNEGDIVIALTRPIIQSLGNVKACIVKESDTPCLLNQRVGRIVPKQNVDVNLKFIYGCLMTDDFTRYVESCCIGCSQPNISTKDIENYMIPDVSYDAQVEFVKFKEQLDKSKAAVQAALDKAQLLFDSLMQQYFG